MKKQNSPIFKKRILIQGSTLFLVGPIGTFFSRLANFLEKNNIKIYKLSFPYHEYGFSKESRIFYNNDISKFNQFLEQILDWLDLSKIQQPTHILRQ